ncbi:MAG: hypothetical protein CMO55_10970 [Verrucomicrobiales bacterium]|nr:hypothetical protein [Verrucomicrobiales bacterium]
MHKNTSNSPRPLNSRQRHFLDRYHITGNLGQSWLEAGYNCSPESASSNAGRVLQREDAQEYLESLQQHDREKSGCTREMIIDRFKQILFSENARDRDVILAGREIARMIGAYNPPEKKPEPQVDTLHEFIKKFRAGEIREDETPPRPTNHQSVHSASLWLPDPGPCSDEPKIEDDETITVSEQAAEPGPTCESPLEQLARRKKEKAVRAAARRDPDWHPHYNPYYDPTNQAYHKSRAPKTIYPGT